MDIKLGEIIKNLPTHPPYLEMVGDGGTIIFEGKPIARYEIIHVELNKTTNEAISKDIQIIELLETEKDDP